MVKFKCRKKHTSPLPPDFISWFSNALFLSQGPKPWDRLPSSKMSFLLTQTADGHTREIQDDVPACSTKLKQIIKQSLEPETLELSIPSPGRVTAINTI